MQHHVRSGLRHEWCETLSNAAVTALFPTYYPAELAALVDQTLSNSVVVRTRVGWRPFPKHGWHFQTGYTVATLGGDLTGAEVVAVAAGVAPPDRDAALAVDASATVGFVDIGTGWDFRVSRQLFVRPALGWSFAVNASTTLDPSVEARTPAARRALDELVQQGQVLLDDTFTSYVHPPWIAVSVGWRFGLSKR